MSDGMSDVVEYWIRKCNICKEKYPSKHSQCCENTYKCDADINVYTDQRKYL